MYNVSKCKLGFVGVKMSVCVWDSERERKRERVKERERGGKRGKER